MPIPFPFSDVGEHDHSLVRDTYHSLKRQLPFLYLIAAVNLVGMHATASGGDLLRPSPAHLLFVLIVWRGVHWAMFAQSDVTTAIMRQELKKTCYLATVISFLFSIWGQYLFLTVQDAREFVILFGTLAAIGCAYGLHCMPVAALMPLSILGLPIALNLILSADKMLQWAGLSLTIVLAAVARMLFEQYLHLHRHMRVRLSERNERRRARAAERKATKLAKTDFLTKVANRRALIEELELSLSDEKRTQYAALTLVDLDGFKPINDVFGHEAGDEMLRLAANQLTAQFPNGFVARMGGDEFAILSDQSVVMENLSGAIEKALGVQLNWKGRALKIEACSGTVLLDDRHLTSKELLRRADIALYRAKSDPLQVSCFFDEALMECEVRRTLIEHKLSSADIRGDLDVHFQPIWCCRTQRISGFEALARWNDSQLGEVQPSEFIPLAEQLGTIDFLTEEILRRACRTAILWPNDQILSLNISARQLCDPRMSQWLIAQLDRGGLSPERVQVEVTETAFLKNFDVARDHLARLKEVGCRLALDDFGAGNSSLNYLREIQFDTVKLDGSFVTNVTNSSHDRELLHGVVALTHSMAMQCVAECIETESQYEIAVAAACDGIQGFYIDKVMQDRPFDVELEMDSR
ncbi:putative bifunctional diguanylate cyclase/phosphodiesterase [Sphingomicrobium clamense]|uniref:EAL domain-containing protein n=1 Tax=Sphingomicrobium clamense TaxID=2851013 RepID=A0ABS6V951_9SPHN|nr:EAL domain-containing protein [Sphingomicrobium sp. B8]MBW0145687.1 EAL domain-containing protein [Sphingomicrobium sp. B8]